MVKTALPHPRTRPFGRRPSALTRNRRPVPPTWWAGFAYGPTRQTREVYDMCGFEVATVPVARGRIAVAPLRLTSVISSISLRATEWAKTHAEICPPPQKNSDIGSDRERRCIENCNKCHNKLIFAVNILVILCRNSFRVLFDKIASVYFTWKIY